MQRLDLVVLSHLRWDFVWQRPQQLLSRLAGSHRVLYVEEPIAETNSPDLQVINSNLAVLKPKISAGLLDGKPPCLWPGEALVAAQIRENLRNLGIRDYALWFYTPAPTALLRMLAPRMVVVDVMDELSNFKFAPPELRQREAIVLTEADVVFTGGYSLYESKKRYNPNTHLFASGVDAEHFRAALSPPTTVPDWVSALPNPRAAYIGVIDERLDYDLIAGTAAALPNVQFLMCGPIFKVDPASLPKAANLHYSGQQAYDDLPRILKGTDVCLMPFARNEATRFISPTKTLEYMAALRPIVSTPIADVERFYSDVVYLADDVDGFRRHIETGLHESNDTRARKARRIESILAEHAWDAIAESMSTIMGRVIVPSQPKQRLMHTPRSAQQPVHPAAG